MSTEGPNKFAFKKSALSDKADKIWSESKNDFSATKAAVNHVQLEKKSLGDVLGKIVATSRQNDESKSTDSSPGAFVFGSKIADRVVQNESGEDSTKNAESTMTATELFKTAVKKDDERNGSTNFREEAEQEAERAKEVEKQHASTSVVEVTTGEEADTTVFQASCKIWVFDKERCQYTEKGVCTLRINKKIENRLTHHRIVARTSGTLRVVINSKVFADMLLERPDKRIRISAFGPDNVAVQIFLLKFGFSKTDTGAEADQFYNTMCDLLKMEKGEQTRKRKADCDLNAEHVKIRDAKDEDEQHKTKTDESTENNETDDDKVDEGFVLVEKPETEVSTESKEDNCDSSV